MADNVSLVTAYELKSLPTRSIFAAFWIINVLSLVSAQIAPQNTAVNAGTPETYLNCSYPGVNQSQFLWALSNFNISMSRNVAFGCSVFNSELYGVDCSTQNSNNLIIRNAQPSQAAVYMCMPGDKTSSSAQFIVLGGETTCSTNPTVQIPVSQSVQLSCGTQVYGGITPVMTWTNSDGTPVSSTPSNSGVNVGSTATVQALIPTVPAYTCSTKFGTPPTGTGYATNIPTYTSSCNTHPLQVLYPPSTPTITVNGDPNSISCTDTLTCSSVSYPSALKYFWTLPDGSTSTGSAVIISQTGINLVFICTASNSQGSSQSSIIFNVTNCPTTTPSLTTETTSQNPGCSCSSDNVGAIVVGVIGGIVGVTLIILLICFCVKSCPLYKYCRAEQYKDDQSFSSMAHPDPHDAIKNKSPPICESGDPQNNYESLKIDKTGENFYENQVETHQYATLKVQDDSVE